MAKIPPIKRLRLEDFPDAPDWLPSLLRILNQYMEHDSAALNGNITIRENLDAQIKTLKIKEGNEPFYFKVETNSRPKGVLISNSDNLDGSSPAHSGALMPEWEYKDETNQIKITKIYGLNSGENYRITFLVHTD